MAPNLIEDYFRRDLSEAEEERLRRLLGRSEEAGLEFSRLAERHYAKLGVVAAGLLAAKTMTGSATHGAAWLRKLTWGAKAAGLKTAMAAAGAVAVLGTGYVAVRHWRTPTPATAPQQGDGLSIELDLGSPKDLAVKVRDSRGALVRDMGHWHWEAGSHRLLWDGLNDAGKPVAPGRYQVDVDFGASQRQVRWLEVH